MKHFILLLIVALLAYGGWQLLNPMGRLVVRNFVRKHIAAIAFIVVVLLVGLAAAASVSSIRIL